eukprot:2982193-Karenia_brevis.AAC.1
MMRPKSPRLQAGAAGSPGANTGGNGGSSSGAAEQADVQMPGDADKGTPQIEQGSGMVDKGHTTPAAAAA